MYDDGTVLRDDMTDEEKRALLESTPVDYDDDEDHFPAFPSDADKPQSE